MNFNKVNYFNELLGNAPSNVKEKYTTQKFKKEKIFMYENDEVKNIYILCEGTINFTVQLEEGKTLEVGTITITKNNKKIDNKNFHIIGYLEVLSGVQQIATTVQAVTDCTCIKMSVETFKYWLQNDINLSLVLNKIMAQDFIEIMNNHSQVLLENSFNNILHSIIEWSKNSCNNDNIIIVKKRQQIANELGMSLRSVYRNLQQLKNEKLISTSGSKIMITNEQLEKIKQLYSSLKS